MTDSRLKMPPPKRTGPIRSVDGLFGPPHPPSDNGPAQAGSGRESASSTVSRGVELGYRVIGEYMRQGEAFARSNGSRPSEGDPVSSDPRKLTERMVEHASELATAWLEFVQTTLVGAPPAPGSRGEAGAQDPGAFDLGGPPAAATAAPPRTVPRAPSAPRRISIEIASKRRAEVTVDLHPEAGVAPLVAHDLRARDPDLPRIHGVTIGPPGTSDRVLVRIAVPDDQPAATYTGLVVDDATNLPCGSVSVRVFDE
jgi:hypothetical protein